MLSISKRLVVLGLALVLFLSSFFTMASTAFAGAGITGGSSSSLNAVGAITSIRGGVSHAKDVTFRIGVSFDVDLKNEVDGHFMNIRKNFEDHFPDIRDNALYLVANSAKSYYLSGTYKIGNYSAGSRKLFEYDSSEALSRVIFLNNAGSMPTNKGKLLLSGYSFNAGSFEKLAKGEAGKTWQQIANNYTKADALALFSWIFAPTSTGATSNSYDIHNRINQYIDADYAHRGQAALDTNAKNQVMRGFLGLLFAGRALTTSGTDARQAWDRAIEEYLLHGNLDEKKNVSFVIDTAITISQTGKHRTLMGTLDYHEFYTAMTAKRSLYVKHNGLKNTSYSGDTYKMINGSVRLSINDAGTNGRISNMYDPDNPFSHGASAVAYPYKRYTTSGGNGRWDNSNSALAIMDVLKLGKNSTNTGDLYGFIAIGGAYEFPQPTTTPNTSTPTPTPSNSPTPTPSNSPTPTPTPANGCPEDPSKCPQPDGRVTLDIPDEYDRPYQVGKSEVIGVPVPITIKHVPDSENSVALWKNVFSNNWQNVNVKFTRVSRSSDPEATVPVNLSKGTVQGFKIDSPWFVGWIKGQNTITIADLATVTEPIEPDTTKKFKYQIEVTFTYKLRDGTEQSYSLNTNIDTASFYREPEVPVIPIRYVSTPSVYSELKEGTPDNESFEAMAGVPSNKRLYLGIGGSEFIVDIELEYKENVDSVWRTYKSIFKGTDSEFKAGDTAPTQTVGGLSVDPHQGGTIERTWTGSIPWTGSNWHSGWTDGGVINTWDYSAQQAALEEAQAWAAEVNGTVVSHTSASDKKTRTFNGWNANVEGGITEGEPGTFTSGNPPVPESGSVEDGTYTPAKDGVPASSTAGTAGSYSYTVKATIPAHEICGPECTNTMPDVVDTWKQKVTFDYMKISKVEVYKIEEGRITQVDNIFGVDNSVLSARIQEGDPNIFYNIAQQNAGGNDTLAQSSASGRLRYSLETLQHDVVVYEEGTRSNKSDGMGKNGNPNSPQGGGHSNPWAKGILYKNEGYPDEYNYHRNRGGVNTQYSATADSTDVATMEWKKFDERRKAKNKVTVISDMLILQTSSGDQAVLYFEKDSDEIESQKQFPPVKATKEEMWDNNPNSASKWTENRINIGSYNGNFTDAGVGQALNKKYHGYSKEINSYVTPKLVNTKFDSNGAGQNASRTRPARPSQLYIYGTEDIVPTNKNGVYVTGKADVFYKRVLQWTSPNAYEGTSGKLTPFVYEPKTLPQYQNRSGLMFNAPYSENHTKVNDIVIHTPVSAEDAMILSLDESRDQRINAPAGGAKELIAERAALEICPLDPALCEFRVLNCRYHLSELLVDIDFNNTTSVSSQLRFDNKATGATVTATQSGVVNPVSNASIDGSVALRLGANGGITFSFSNIGLTNEAKGTISIDFDYYTVSSVTGQIPLFSMSGYGLTMDKNKYYLYLGSSESPVVEFTRKQVLNAGNVKSLKVVLGLGSALDTKVYEDGVELTKTVLSNPLKPEGYLGTSITFGYSTLNNVANLSTSVGFRMDNLRITKDGGSSAHTEECYITVENHDVKLNHVHTADCIKEVDGQYMYVCNGLPKNVLSENNTHVYTRESINTQILTSILGATTSSGSGSGGGSEVEFNYTGSDQYFTAPETGLYQITAFGASGGDYSTSIKGGRGGKTTGFVQLTQGEKLKILVGQQGAAGGGRTFGGGGASYDGEGASGGGGTFIYPQNPTVTYNEVWKSEPKSTTTISTSNTTYRVAYPFGDSIAPLPRHVIEVKLKNNTGKSIARVYGAGSNSTYIEIPISTFDTEVKTYYFNIGELDSFTGMRYAGSVLLALANGVGDGGTLDIESIRLLEVIEEPILVAGGGGGASHNLRGIGGDGGGLEGKTGGYINGQKPVGGSQTSGFARFYGARATAHNGGGGGGYWGGRVGTGYNDSSSSPNHAGGGGGSGYIAPYIAGVTSNDTHTGHGKVIIKPFTGASSGGSAGVNGVYGYTWEDIFGANWNKFITVTQGASTNADGESFLYSYTGAEQVFTAPLTGEYLFEAWGGKGGTGSAVGGKGGYAKGKINLEAGQKVNLVVGNQGTRTSTPVFGGGGGGSTNVGSGGGASYAYFENNSSTVRTLAQRVITSQLTWNNSSDTSYLVNKPVSSKHGLNIVLSNPTGTIQGVEVKANSGYGEPYTVVGWIPITAETTGDQSFYIDLGSQSSYRELGDLFYLAFKVIRTTNSGSVTVKAIDLTEDVPKPFLVAGGGGGGGASTNLSFGGAGGGVQGTSGRNHQGEDIEPLGGTQTTGYYPLRGEDSVSNRGAGAGGGYWGGFVSTSTAYYAGGAGGSSYIQGLKDGQTIMGHDIMPSPLGGNQVGNDQEGYIRITIPSAGSVSVTLNTSYLMQNWTSIPKKLPDGSPNFVFTDNQHIAKGYSSIGVFANSESVTYNSGAVIEDVVHPSSGKTLQTIKLPVGTNNPVISVKDLGLVPNAEYMVEFDYWTSGSNATLSVALQNPNVMQNNFTATGSVQHAKFKFTASNTGISSNTVFKFFNDTQRPNPTNIYITGVKIYVVPSNNVHEHNENCKITKILDCNEPHHNGGHYDGSNTICWDACGIDHNHVKDKDETSPTGGGTLKRGTFINLDYGFTVYFPNVGDFAQQPLLHGIGEITTTRGMGYYNNMDLTEYTHAKRVSFPFHVRYKDEVYTAGSWIELELTEDYHDFYLLLANNEASGAEISYESIPINGRPIGNPMNENFVTVNNKERDDSYKALHGAFKNSYIDVVGRIGNFLVSDTEDFRFANLFKNAKGTGEWLVEGLVPMVDPKSQKGFYGDLIDIRGNKVTDTDVGLNTYGTQSWASTIPRSLPINALDNTIPALRGEYLKTGYDILGDISTIGNYQEGVVRILPYYYKLDLDTGTITPLDAYTPTEDTYTPLNLFGGADNGALPDGLSSYEVKIDWVNESDRRNYGLDESVITDRAAEYLGEPIKGIINVEGGMEEGVVGVKKLTIPLGNYTNIGNAQRIVLDKNARTFMGTSRTYGEELDPTNMIPVVEFDVMGQRWHWKLGTPSSTVFVPAGQTPTPEVINQVKSGNSLVLLTADIIVIGDVYTLRWDQAGTTSFTASVNGVTRTFSTKNSNLPPVIALYDLNQSSAIDVNSTGSH